MTTQTKTFCATQMRSSRPIPAFIPPQSQFSPIKSTFFKPNQASSTLINPRHFFLSRSRWNYIVKKPRVYNAVGLFQSKPPGKRYNRICPCNDVWFFHCDCKRHICCISFNRVYHRLSHGTLQSIEQHGTCRITRNEHAEQCEQESIAHMRVIIIDTLHVFPQL